MPFPHVIHPDYRDQNEVSRYPFADNANGVSTDGRVAIDPTIFVDASLYPVGGDERLYISQIDVAPREITIYIGSAASPRLVSATFDPYDDETYLLAFRDAYERDAGILVSEPSKLRIFAAWPNGTHLFRILATSLVASCCIPTPEVGVRGILTEAGELLQGDVWIVGENGVVVREDGGQIRVDIVGDPLFLRNRCEPLDLFNPPQFLLSINDCGPDDYGNFNLTVDNRLADKTVLRIYPDGTTLRATLVGRRVQG